MRSGLALAIFGGILGTLGGCAYQPGTFRYPASAFAGTHVTLDCVDLAVARRAIGDDPGQVVAQYELGNRCDRPQLIDLAGVHVVGHARDGRELKLVAIDPDAELTARPLDARSHAAEAIGYRAAGDAGDAELVSACADVATIVHGAAPRWVCVRTPPPVAPVDDEPADADAAPACKNAADDYVGHRPCGTRFGAWSTPVRAPPMTLEWGAAGRSVQLPVASPTGAQLTAPAITSAFRFTIGVHGGLYLGAETEIGGVGGNANAALEATATAPPAPGPAVFLGGYFLAGVRGAVTHRLSLAAEVAAGGRLIAGTVTDPSGTGGTAASEPSGLVGQGVVEARVRAELWLNPWVSAGVTAGTSMIARGEDMGGAFLSLHTRAFGGDRPHEPRY